MNKILRFIYRGSMPKAQYSIRLRGHHIQMCDICFTNIKHTKSAFSKINFIKLVLIYESINQLSNLKVIILPRA